MAKDQIFFGRNIFLEALKLKIKISEVFVANDSARKWADEHLKKSKSSLKLNGSIPSDIRNQNHQGIAFRCNHVFYYELSSEIISRHKCVLFTNHVEDPQNLGSIIRSAAAFNFTLLVHESRRSAEMNATVMKTSAGTAFRMQFAQVSNLVNAASQFREKGFWLYGLEGSDEAEPLYNWKPQFPIVLTLGSEGSGLSRTTRSQMDGLISVPMAKDIESLNVVQAGSIAMSWVNHSISAI